MLFYKKIIHVMVIIYLCKIFLHYFVYAIILYIVFEISQYRRTDISSDKIRDRDISEYLVIRR